MATSDHLDKLTAFPEAPDGQEVQVGVGGAASDHLDKVIAFHEAPDGQEVEVAQLPFQL